MCRWYLTVTVEFGLYDEERAFVFRVSVKGADPAGITLAPG